LPGGGVGDDEGGLRLRRGEPGCGGSPPGSEITGTLVNPWNSSPARVSVRTGVLVATARSHPSWPCFDAALAVNPRLANALYGRGIAKRRNGDPAGANADVAAAKAINPGIAQEFAISEIE
jgi:hypothetical protein